MTFRVSFLARLCHASSYVKCERRELNPLMLVISDCVYVFLFYTTCNFIEQEGNKLCFNLHPADVTLTL